MNLTIFFNPELDLLQLPYHRMPVLERIIGMGSVEYLPKSSESLLAEKVLQEPIISCPIASLQRLAEGLSVEDDWMLVTPVHLLLQRDTFSLLHPSELAVSREELYALVQTFNQHFAEDGMRFEISPAGYCYVRFPCKADFVTSSPYLATNQKIDDYLPRGLGGARINRVMNEMQMLLFDHPLNQVRETNGQLLVNGVWLHGEGSANEASASTWLAGRHALLVGLGNLVGSKVHQAESFSELNRQAKQQAVLDSLVVLDNLELFEDAWLQPALKALRLFQIKSLKIVLTVNGRSIKVSLNAPSSWKLWSKSKTLEQIINHE